MVGVYIALSEFARKKFIAGGLPPERIIVKPNFLSSDPGMGEHAGKFGLLVGRLAPEKGLDILLKAWVQVGQRFRLKIIGGPVPGERPALECIEWLGPRDKARVYAEMKDASFLVFPSESYENCPITIIEAYATGLPVIASSLGSTAEMVVDHQTGRHFQAGSPVDLAAKVEWATAHSQDLAAMARRARQEFELKYSAVGNYLRLMEIYSVARVRNESALVER
jgi:glycosyltransferase involved in cell wall biosynthesis